jgi:putative hydrolase of the HAD superfamily
MPIRAILFDLDDTLTDRARSIQKLVPQFLAHFQEHLRSSDPDEILCCILAGDKNGYASRRDLAVHLQSSLAWRQVPEIEQLVNFWHEHFPRCNVERTGVTATLGAFHNHGFKLGVVTNGMPTQHVKLDALGIVSMMSAIVVSEELGIKKPDPQIFQTALNQLAVAASEAVFIGDNPILDVAGARSAGMRAIWLNSDGRDWPKDVGPPPQTITSFEHLPTLAGLG